MTAKALFGQGLRREFLVQRDHALSRLWRLTGLLALVTVAVLSTRVEPVDAQDNTSLGTGATIDLGLSEGENIVTVEITAQNGVATETYTVTVTREEEDLSLTPSASDPVAAFPSTATYTIRFQGAWTRTVTPDGLPGGAHFSRLIGGVHNADVTFLESGGTASAGVESMAEVGGTSTLRREVNAARNADPPTALSVLEGTTSFISPTATRTLSNRTLTTEFPRVTLTTMIAPSHDWFVGVSGLLLLDASGLWLRSDEVNLFPWDAGTEEGDNFSLSPSVTTRGGVITSIRGTGKFTTDRIASLTFTLQSIHTERSLDGNTRPGVVDIGPPVAAVAGSGTVTYTLGGTDAAMFDLVSSTGQLRTKTGVTYDADVKSNRTVTVTATDTEGSTVTTVDIAIENIDEPPEFTGPADVTVNEDHTGLVGAYTKRDPEGLATNWGRFGETAALTGDDADAFDFDKATGRLTFADPPDFEARTDNTYEFTLNANDGVLDGSLDITVNVVNLDERADPPVQLGAQRGVIDVALTATLADPDNVVSATWQWQRSTRRTGGWADIANTDASSYTPTADDRNQYLRATVSYEDGHGPGKSADAATEFTTVNERSSNSGPTPSTVDFEWTVEHDIDELDSGHDIPTGMWSDGATLWLLDDPDGAGDAVYAYSLESGERAEGRDFELSETNRAPSGVWSDRTTIWISDSGPDRLFAYDRGTGERTPERDIELDERNAHPRGIWSDGETMWVLDNRREALFAYDLGSGELLGECALADANDGPHGIWSDRTTIWVSNDDPKRLFAYRLPMREELDAAPGDRALKRVQDEEFTELSKAGNNSPRGIWSDGDVMYVADENDGRVYSYNMPDAIDARLVTLELSRVEFGEFSPLRHDYMSETIPDGNIATLTAMAAQDGASVEIEPADHDGDPENGYHVRLLPGLEIVLTVTSADGSRERVYRLLLGEEEATAAGACLRGAVAVGFSLVFYGGGSIEELEACAESRHVATLYALEGGAWVPYIIGAPGSVNRAFVELFSGGVPRGAALVARSAGPPSEDPSPAPLAEASEECLRGEVARGFSIVVFRGGSVEELEGCARSTGVTTLYALDRGAWVPYIIGAPGLVNRSFVALFAGGLGPGTPLVAKSDGQPAAGPEQGGGG